MNFSTSKFFHSYVVFGDNFVAREDESAEIFNGGNAHAAGEENARVARHHHHHHGRYCGRWGRCDGWGGFYGGYPAFYGGYPAFYGGYPTVPAVPAVV